MATAMPPLVELLLWLVLLAGFVLLSPCSPLSVWKGACGLRSAAPASADLPEAVRTAVVEPSHARPVLVVFHARWCGPCQRLAPELDRLAEREDLLLVRRDVDDHLATAEALGVRSVPTLVLWHRGREVARTAGYLPADAIVRWIATHASAAG